MTDMTDETKGDGMTLEQVLAEWVLAGGSHHGPNVETVTMPLSDYVSFRNSHLASQYAMRVDEAMVQRADEAAEKWASDNGFVAYMAPTGYVRAAIEAVMRVDDRVYALARRCLHIAYVWNDHNFEAAHLMARETAKACGIDSLEQGNDFLATIGKPQP